MSTVVPPKGHRHTQSAVVPAPAASPQNPQNPHHLNVQSYVQNSLGSEMSDTYQSNPSTPPRTPRRNDQPSQNRTTEHGSKQKSRIKNRPKNVMTSPAVPRKGHNNTPPFTRAQSGGVPSSAKPISTPAAYAGATFHASPAPSALPIPSFYSKSVPDSPGMRGFKMKEASLSESTTPPLPSSDTPSQQRPQLPREESPLDFFFKADREEKARAKSATSSQNMPTTTGPFNPPRQSSRVSQTPPATGSQIHKGRNSKTSPSAIFAMELDGEGSAGSPIGPAFSTPYAERINAARPRQQPTLEAQPSLDRTEALKAYLFSGQFSPSPNPSSSLSTKYGPPQEQNAPSAAPSASLHHSRSTGPPQRQSQNNSLSSHDSKSFSHASRTSGRSSGLRQEVTPTRTPTKTPERVTGYSTSPTPSRTYGNANSSDTSNFIGNIRSHTSPHGVSSDRSADIQGMENSLRRILKLDSLGSSGTGATVSVPN